LGRDVLFDATAVLDEALEALRVILGVEGEQTSDDVPKDG
jgi:hypothetical protein